MSPWGCPSVGALPCVPWTRAHTRLHSPSHSLNARSCCTALRRLRPHHCRACEGRGRGTSRTVLFCDAGQHPSARVCHAHAIRPVPRVMMCAACCAALGGFVRLRNFFRREETLSFCSLCESVAPLHRSAPSPLCAPAPHRIAPSCPTVRMVGCSADAHARADTHVRRLKRAGLSREY
jgi:hypothetical protein